MAEQDLEAPLADLRARVDELSGTPGREEEAERLRADLEQRRKAIYAGITPWQRTQIARNAGRPNTLDYINTLCNEFTEVKGDRRFADDPALVCGFAFFHDRPVCVIGHQKGRDTKAKIHRNFGMPKPEGYRKAMRVMELAAKFARPIITFVDTPGAYPGLDAEERGQAEAIAYNLREMAKLPVPIIVNVTGEGGSGGALAIAIGDRVNMLEYAIYSVISPEGCASILWRDPGKAELAAAAMKITAPELKSRGIVDDIVPEPLGGVHKDPEAIFPPFDALLQRQLAELAALSPAALVEQRYQKFRSMGRLGAEFVEA